MLFEVDAEETPQERLTASDRESGLRDAVRNGRLHGPQRSGHAASLALVIMSDSGTPRNMHTASSSST